MSGDDAPSKQEIVQVFKKLRAVSSNKVCFDCGTNNPTWASVTYGVFICIDCSATHRGLGVHLSFVRSTQLDTNWTWLQIRAMQLGGNANATQFFSQHGCHSTDAQQKYKSRAAQLYREKLHHLAAQAQRLHGNKLHLESSHEPSSVSPSTKDVDFFDDHHHDAGAMIQSPSASNLAGGLFANTNRDSARSSPSPAVNGSGDDKGPSVDHVSNPAPAPDSEPRKAVIGQRKAPAKKVGKKGLGAQKVQANFEDIQKKAETLDQERLSQPQTLAHDSSSDTVSGLSERFAVQDLSEKLEKRETMVKDPKKADQAERLGMGGLGGAKSGVSHSVFSEMKSIKQEGARTAKPPKSNFLQDDWEIVTTGSTRSNNNDDLFSFKKAEDDEFFDAVEETKPKPAAKVNYSTSSGSDDAQKKFGGAKAISSDMYFGNNASGFETQTTLSRFEGSSAISSDDYFGNGTPGGPKGGPSGGYASYGSAYMSNMPDMGDIKDSVRSGVTKVAGRLSQLSSSVQTYISDSYGN